MSSASAVLPDALMKRRAMASSFPRWTVSVCSISVFVIFCCVVGSFLSGLLYISSKKWEKVNEKF